MKITAFGPALGAGLLAASLVSCGRSDRTSSRPADAMARPVRVARASLQPMARTIAVTGTLAAQETSTLSAKVPGPLQRLEVDLGSVVHRGDLLAQIEPRDYELGLARALAALGQARATLGLEPDGEDDTVQLDRVTAVKQAKAVLDEAAKNRERVKSLSREGIASQSELDTVEANHTVALARYETAFEDTRTRVAALAQRRAECELARKQLADTDVRAPFDGVVQARPASLGEYLAPGTPIVRLVETDPLRLRLAVPERECGLVRVGQEVRLTVEGDTNVYCGSLKRLSPALDEQTRLLTVEADVPAQGRLRPGLFARARIVVREREQVLCVPLNAIITFAGLEKVIAVQDGKALEKPVTTARRSSGWAEIVEGLSLGDVVVLEPGPLQTGQPVQVIGNGKVQTAASTEEAGR